MRKGCGEACRNARDAATLSRRSMSEVFRTIFSRFYERFFEFTLLICTLRSCNERSDCRAIRVGPFVLRKSDSRDFCVRLEPFLRAVLVGPTRVP